MGRSNIAVPSIYKEVHEYPNTSDAFLLIHAERFCLEPKILIYILKVDIISLVTNTKAKIVK
jgi:hypothetical protein